MPKRRVKKIVQKPNDNFRVLFIGDIVGEVGRGVVKALLPSLKKKLQVDYTIANGEHLSDRVGVDINYVNEMCDAGVDLFTTGNHVWRKEELKDHIGRADVPVIRPANFSGNVPGEGFRIVRTKKGNLLVANFIGRENIEAKAISESTIGSQQVDSPFDVADKLLASAKGYRFSIVDFHAEMTSEKVAFGRYLDGRVGAVVGTHTHVPTADAMILPAHSAYVTDVGMTGPRDSVLGVKAEIIIDRFKEGMPQKFELAEGKGVFNAVLITYDADGRAKSIKRIDRKL